MSLAHSIGDYMAVRLNRKGRPAKVTARRDSKGKARGEWPDAVMEVVLSQPHRRSLPVKKDPKTGKQTDMRQDQKAEHPLGIFQLRGQISEFQYQAGRKWAKVVAQYRATLDAPDPIRRPVPGYGGTIPPDEARRRKDAYDDAFKAMEHQKWQKAVSRVCVAEEFLPPGSTLYHLTCGLDRLVAFWGLTTKGGR